MAKVIQTRIPSSGEMVYRYPECPYVGDIIHCTAGKQWAGILTEDHFCAGPGTSKVITCGERHQKQYRTCPMDKRKKDVYRKRLCR